MSDKALQPFYFNVVLWGKQFRELFLDLCLSSLLAPRNLESFKDIKGCKFLVATTPEDWTAMQSHKAFVEASKFIEFVFLEINPSREESDKMLAMSSGHKKAAQRTFQDKAYGVFISPDTILSIGFGECLVKHARAGRRVVLISSIRYETEGLLQDLESSSILGQVPIQMSGRELVKLSNHRMHSESLASSWEIPYFRLFPTHLWWGVGKKRADAISMFEPGNDGIILYTFSWSPILVDYATLQSHDDDIFDNWTLDGDYVHRNFGNDESIYAITDSDEAMLISLTPKDQYPVPISEHKGITFFSKPIAAKISRNEKLLRLSHVYYHECMDELKRRTFLEPVIYHADDIGPEWDRRIKESKKVLDEVLATDATGYLPSQEMAQAFFPGLGADRKFNQLLRLFVYGFVKFIHAMRHPWYTFTYLLKFPAYLIPRPIKNVFRRLISLGKN